MGTKRVGWARIKSLVNENQNDLKHRRASVKAALTGNTTLTAADYGSVILIDASAAATNFTITLPTAPAVGDTFKFQLIKNSAADSEVLLDSGTNHKFEGYALKFTASAIATAFHAHQKLGWGDSTKKGAGIHVVCVDATVGAVRWAIIDSRSDTTWINAFS